MNRFVLDCSLTMSWFFPDEITEYSESIMDALLNGEAVVPHIWFYEVTNTLQVGERKKRLQRSESIGILERLQQLSIILDNTKTNTIMPELLSLAGKYKLSAYDAAYIELSLRLGLPLATCDKQMAESAIAEGIKLMAR